MKATKDKTKKTSELKRFLWILILALSFIPLPFVYNSCGEGGSLQFSYILQSLEGSFSVEINKGDYYTQKKDVELELKVPEKKVEQQIIKYEMFVSDTIDCSEGEWEPYHLFKPWVLKTEEMEEKEHFVFVKFREERKDSIHYVYQDAGLEDSRAETSCFQSSIFFDDKPPRLELTSYPAKRSNQSSAEFRFSVQDSSSAQTECKLNDESWEECSSVWTRNNLEEGDHTFYIKSEDLVQNKSEVSFSWQIDFNAPGITLTEKPEDPNNDLSSAIEIQIKGSFKSLSYYLGVDSNGRPDVSLMEEHSRGKMNFPVRFQTKEGRNYFKIEGTDEFGNSNSIGHSWFVDRTPPSKPQFRSSPPPHRIFGSDEISFDLLAEDNHEVTDIYYELDDGHTKSCSAVPYQENQKRCQKDFRLDQGSHSIAFIARDRVGNESAPLRHDWDINFTSKSKTQFVQVLSAGFSNMVDILFVVDDSSGMGKTYQKKLAREFSGFIDELQNIDWRIAFTKLAVEWKGTKSKLPSGLFVPVVGFQSKYFFASSSSLPSLAVQGTQKTFEDTIQSIGTDGGALEQGFAAVDQVLKRYKDCQTSTTPSCKDPKKSQPNKEFFRSDAVLAVIVFSNQDTNEDFRVGKTITPTDLEKRIKDKFFHATKRFVFHSILDPAERHTAIRIPDLKACHEAGDLSSTWKRGETYSHKYLGMSKLTNGKVMNIESVSYTDCLRRFGSSIRSLVKGFQLECKPVAEHAGGQVDEPMIRRNTDPNAADNASYSFFDEPFDRSGLSLSFQNPLPVGKYKITYHCAP